mgnify:CR=1 FL=1
MKYSKQREAVLNTVLWSNEHPNAEMVYEKVRKEIPNISLGTVYRNLNKLAELGTIKKIYMPTQSDRFDKTLEHHDHMYCEKCHQLFDISMSNLNEINQIVEDNTGFQILSHDIVFQGICRNCRQNKK